MPIRDLIRRSAPAALAACALLLPAGAAAHAAPASPGGNTPAKPPTKPAPVPSLAVTPALLAGPGIPTSMPPAGLSVEYPVLASWMGEGACAAPALISELRRLGSPPLQVAGNSQDMTVPAGILSGPQPNWERSTLYQLPTAFWARLHCLLASSPDPLTVGLNMRRGEPAWAQRLASEALAADPAVGFSLGNEPDLYRVPNYAALTQPLPGEEAQAVALYLRLAGELRPAVGSAPVVTPEMSRPDNWRRSFATLIAGVHPQAIGVHMYPLTACLRAGDVTVKGLLSERAGQAPARLSWVPTAAASAGIPAIITEANSASCGGRAGVSDTPASAVWAIRFVLSALRQGFREVRFHASGNAYDPFVISGGQLIARPLEYAIAELNTWIGEGSKVISLRPLGALRATVIAPRAAPATAGATAVTAQPLLILDNEGEVVQRVQLRWASTLRTELISSRSAGVHPRTVAARGGRATIAVPAQSILAVSAPASR